MYFTHSLSLSLSLSLSCSEVVPNAWHSRRAGGSGDMEPQELHQPGPQLRDHPGPVPSVAPVRPSEEDSA